MAHVNAKWILILWPAVSAVAFYDSCSVGVGSIGSFCDRNEDCNGFAVVCMSGKCQCHPDYLEKTDQTLNSKHCTKLPDRIGSQCSGSCKLPMFCNNGNCECIRSTAIKDICLADSSLGQSCNKNHECVVPFSSCIHGTCQCIAGTAQVGTSCQASRNCPTGAKPGGPCFRNVSSTNVIQNFAESGSKVDNCTAKGYYCYTDDVSGYGVCCPAVCPLDQVPDWHFTCDPNSVNKQLGLCPDETHYCNRMAGQSYSSTVCCRRLCLDPNPVFIKGSCYSRAFLNGPCRVDEQCDGGYGMQCSSRGLCQCRSGFVPYSDNFTKSYHNPPQTCVKMCAANQTQYSGECFKGRLLLHDRCTVDSQCTQGALCKRGLCLCDCDNGFVASSINNGCVLADTRTVSPNPVSSGSTCTCCTSEKDVNKTLSDNPDSAVRSCRLGQFPEPAPNPKQYFECSKFGASSK